MTKKQPFHDLVDIEALTAAAAGRFQNAYLIYCRRSTDDPNNQQNSIGYQEIENAKFARGRELPISKLTWPGFCTDGVIRERHSGHKEHAQLDITADGVVTHQIVRPKFSILMQLLARRAVKGVVVLCWDRLSRNDGDSALIRKLKARGADIQLRNADYSDGSSGTLHMSIDATFARYFSDNISEKVRDALRKMRGEGKCTYHSPIGYLDRGADNKVVDPDRAPIVREIFNKYETGSWSLSSLASWAVSQGLTTKPRRRRRTRQERLDDVEPGAIPSVSATVSSKTIESILGNPFYIGKIRKFGTGRTTQEWMDGLHAPIISAATYQNVQAMLHRRNVSVHYPRRAFYLFRGMIRCGCGRSYSPYVKKGITYYRTRCRPGCTNSILNATEKRIDQLVVELFRRVSLTSDELRELEVESNAVLRTVSTERENAMSALTRERQKLRADLEYVTRERWTLLRTGAVQPDALRLEEERLTRTVLGVEERLAAYSVTASKMIEEVVSFTELINGLAGYYETAIDVEKHGLIALVFTELIFDDGILKYRATEGFDFLLNRDIVSNDLLVPREGVLPNSPARPAAYILSHLDEVHTALKVAAQAVGRVLLRGSQGLGPRNWSSPDR